MENRDFLIEGGLSAIEKKIEGLVKPIENYKFKTNCKYGDLNIKTLPIPSLIATFLKKDSFSLFVNKYINYNTVTGFILYILLIDIYVDYIYIKYYGLLICITHFFNIIARMESFIPVLQ